MAGFTLAIEQRADAVELDVHATRDSILVVHHDPLLADGRAIAAQDWASIEGDGDDATRVPRLAEVLALLRDRAIVFVELKGRATEALAVSEARVSGARCALHSFDHRAVLAARALAPELPTGILLSSRLVDTVATMRSAGAGTLWQEAAQIDRELVDEVHGVGGAMIAWTVNDPREVERLALLGVDGICTDDPAMTRSMLDRL